MAVSVEKAQGMELKLAEDNARYFSYDVFNVFLVWVLKYFD